jgi:hypothetical protein
VERKMQKAEKKVKLFLGRSTPKNEGDSEQAASSSKVRAIAMGTFKTALDLAVTLVPDPFKGPVEALRKVVDVIEVCVRYSSAGFMPLKCCIES